MTKESMQNMNKKLAREDFEGSLLSLEFSVQQMNSKKSKADPQIQEKLHPSGCWIINTINVIINGLAFKNCTKALLLPRRSFHFLFSYGTTRAKVVFFLCFFIHSGT